MRGTADEPDVTSLEALRRILPDWIQILVRIEKCGTITDNFRVAFAPSLKSDGCSESLCYEGCLVQGGYGWPDSTLQQSLIIHTTGRRGAEYANRFQNVTLTAPVGADEHVHQTKL
jgi:hypothetical protein